MKIDAGRCLLEGTVGAIVGTSFGLLMGYTVATIAASSAIFGAVWIIKSIARQLLSQSSDPSSAKTIGLRLVLDGVMPAGIAIAHYALNIFSTTAVSLVWGLFALEAALLAADSRDKTPLPVKV